MQLGSVTPEQMSEINRLVSQDLGLDQQVRIENASFGVAETARQMVGSLTGTPIVVLVGAGGTGAVGAAVARRLASWSAKVTILLACERDKLHPTTATQLGLAEQYGVKVFDPGALMPPAKLIIDGLVGYGFRGKLLGSYAELVSMVVKVKVPILAIDVPSGLDAVTGKADQPAIRADTTVALGYPVAGVRKPFAKNVVGNLIVCDLGIPALMWHQVRQVPPDFSAGPLVPVDD